MPRKAEATRHTTHGSADEMVQITIGGCRQLQSAETNIVPSNFLITRTFVLHGDFILQGDVMALIGELTSLPS